MNYLAARRRFSSPAKMSCRELRTTKPGLELPDLLADLPVEGLLYTPPIAREGHHHIGLPDARDPHDVAEVKKSRSRNGY